ncbi:MAG: hypothetical protein MR031_02795 [Tenericutes bacterium]|nr:hypothetical protein [Mycoplasmatota bacterium]
MTKNKRKKRSKKIFIAILMILFSGVVLTASTYAWFTANKTVTVEQIEVNVAASNGLQISVDATNWKTLISNADIQGAGTKYTGAVNQLPTTSIVPTSSIGEIDTKTGFMKMFKGDIVSNASGTNILKAERSTETHSTTTGDFIAFDLFFQVTEDTPVYLTDASNVIAVDASKGIENAARVAFVEQGNAAAGTAVGTVQALKSDGTTPAIIWEPNTDVHKPAAVVAALSTYGITTSEAGAARINYNGVKAPIPEGENIPLNSTDEKYFSAVTPKLTSVAAGIPNDAYLQLFTLKAGTTKVRIYMWVEGQDVDCENNASGSSLAYNLQFSVLNKA